MNKQTRLQSLKDIEPFLAVQEIRPETVEWHIEYYKEHGEFIMPLTLEIAGRRCERMNIEALLVDGNHRLHAAKALGLTEVLVMQLDLRENV